MFGNSLIPQLNKNRFSMANGMMPESELKLAGDMLLPDRSGYDKDLREEKSLKRIG